MYLLNKLHKEIDSVFILEDVFHVNYKWMLNIE